MRCLSVRQPWAWAIVHGPKRIENRSWTTNHRGRLLIHAGKSRAEYDGGFRMAIPGLPAVSDLDFGAIVGHVELVDVVPLARVASDPFAAGPWCWVLEDPVAIRPVPWPGRLALFEVDSARLNLDRAIPEPADRGPGPLFHARGTTW